MDSKYNIHYTTRDRLLRAWEEAMDLVRKLETWSRETEDKEVAKTFAAFAEDEALVSAKLFELLSERDA